MSERRYEPAVKSLLILRRKSVKSFGFLTKIPCAEIGNRLRWQLNRRVLTSPAKPSKPCLSAHGERSARLEYGSGLPAVLGRCRPNTQFMKSLRRARIGKGRLRKVLSLPEAAVMGDRGPFAPGAKPSSAGCSKRSTSTGRVGHQALGTDALPGRHMKHTKHWTGTRTAPSQPLKMREASRL